MKEDQKRIVAGAMVAGKGSELVTRVGLVGLSVAPPAVVGAQLWPAVSRHPVLALLLFLGYQLLILIVGFAAKVFGDLQSRWVKRAADTLDRRLLWRTSRFERDYRAAVVSQHRFVDLKGLATRGDYAPGLEAVFVDVSLAPRPAYETPQEALAGTVPSLESPEAGAAPERRSIQDFLDEQQGVALAVIGAPGTGKTTLLKHLTLCLAQDKKAGKKARRDLPVLLLLRDHAAAIAKRSDITLSEVIRASLRRLTAEEPTGWFERQLQDGRCVVLLDGLDEVAREEERRIVATWVEKQIEEYEQNDFVLTSRPHGYLTAPLNRAQVLQVRRFTGEQISRFVHGWYRAITKLSTGVEDAGVDEDARAEAEDLLKRLRARPVLYDLAANPLLLTMIANVHRYRGALPGSRAELYREICEVLLWRRQQAKNPADADAGVSGAKKEIVLRELAYQMMAARLRDIDADQAADFLRSALFRISLPTTPEGVDTFLASITASGLLMQRERGLYAFAHLTLQEHLAALHLQHQGMGKVLADAVDDEWWRETTLLYAARVDPAPIVAACLASQTTSALALAFDCADDATEFSPETARHLEALREEALTEPVGSPRRRLMTAVTLTRQLKETVCLSDDTNLCARPVTKEVYRLFAADHPDATLRRLQEGSPDETAVGMTRHDAAALVRWVNDLLPEESGWRLPTETEIQDPAFRLVAHSAHHTVWHLPPSLDSATLPALWLPDGAPHPWSIQLRTDTNNWPGRCAEIVLDMAQLDLISVAYRVLERVLERVRSRRSRLRSRGRGRGRSRALDFDFSNDFDFDLDFSLARRLAKVLVRDRDIVRFFALQGDIDSAMGFASAHTRDLGRVLDCVRDRARDFEHRLDRVRDRARYFDVERDLTEDRVRDFDRALARARACISVRDIDQVIALVLDFDRVLDRDRDLVFPRERVAAWLFTSLRLLTEPHERPRLSSRAVSDKEPFVRPLRGDWGAYAVFPEDLQTAVQSATVQAATVQMLSHAEPNTDSYVLSKLGARLAQETESLLASFADTAGNPHPIDAACFQLVTHALAAVADQELHDPHLANLYRTIAAGITVLQQRADGTITPSETIILARA